jgi:hypothetical protein
VATLADDRVLLVIRPHAEHLGKHERGDAVPAHPRAIGLSEIARRILILRDILREQHEVIGLWPFNPSPPACSTGQMALFALDARAGSIGSRPGGSLMNVPTAAIKLR